METEYPYSFRIASLGGGTGQYAAIKGLKRINNPDNITAVTAPTDSGGSSGRLRSALEVLPPGDTRQCLLAFAPDDIHKELVDLFNYRFPEDVNNPLSGHNPINIELSALEKMYGPEAGIKAFQKLHNIPGNILPVSINKTHLWAKYTDGQMIEGESDIDLKYENDKEHYDPTIKIDFVSLTSPAYSNPDVLTVLENADMILFPPGDLYTSTIPHLLVDNIADTIVRSQALKIYCGNLMTKPGETEDFTLSRFISELTEYMGEPAIDLVICNQNSLPEKVLLEYARDNQMPVEIDLEECKRLLPKATIKPIPGLAEYSRYTRVLRHNSALLAQSVLEEGSKLLNKKLAIA